MENLREQLKSSLKCLMCSGILSEPKLLNCFHVLCKTCLTRNAGVVCDGRQVSCPLCSAITLLPENGDIDALPTSEAHVNMTRVLRLMEVDAARSSGLPRCSCKQRNPSTSYCCDCLRYLCEQCIGAHRILCEEHNFFVLEEIQHLDMAMVFHRPSFCSAPEHTREILKYFCNSCHTCLCEKCLRGHRRDHDILDLNVKAVAQQAVFQEHVSELDGRLKVEQEKMDAIKEQVFEIERNAEGIKVQVNKAAEEVINFIKENKGNILRQIDEQVKGTKRQEAGQLCLLRQICAAKDHMSVLSKYTTAPLVMESKKLAEKRLHNLFKMQVKFDIAERLIKFIPNSELYKIQEVGLGSVISVVAVDASKCSVHLESKAQYLQALREISLRVLIRDSSGELSTRGARSKVEVTVDPSNGVEHLKVYRTAAESHIELIPKVPGDFTVSVMVNGQHVSNSPIGLDVKPQELKSIGELVITGMRNPLKQPWGIAVNKSNTKIAIADFISSCVFMFSIEGSFLRKIRIKGKDETHLNYPHGVAFIDEKDVVVCDGGNHRLVIFDTNTGEVLNCFGCRGEGPGEFQSPRGVHVDEHGRIMVCDCINKCIQVFTREGKYLFQIDQEICGEGFDPHSVSSHGDFVIVSNYSNNALHVVQQQGSLTSVMQHCVIRGEDSAGGKLEGPCGLTIDKDGNLLVCEYGKSRIQKFTLDGRRIGITADKIGKPRYIAVLADGRILVTCDWSNKVQIVG